MTNPTGFRVAQGFDVLVPRSGEAYPIPCDEWEFLKKRARQLSSHPWFYHTLGSILIGASLSTLIAVLVGAISTTNKPNAEVIAWAVTIVTGVCGALSLAFAEQQRRNQRENAGDLVGHMEIIERRYERKTA